METQYAERIILIGPTGCGKTTVGAEVAALLGWSFVDVDEQVARAAGRSVPDIFAADGEARFRELESAALAQATEPKHTVVATGAGIGERSQNVEIMRARGWVVLVRSTPETALERMRAATGVLEIGAARPMLAGDDPLARMRALEARRDAWYARADDTVSTEERPPAQAAAAIVASLAGRGHIPPGGAEPRSFAIRAGRHEYEAVVQWGGLASLGERLRARALPARLFIVADAAVWALYGMAVRGGLEHAGSTVLVHTVPPGEANKSREMLNAIHDWLADQRAERGEAIVALGGGVTGDLAGFAAATYLRGMPLIQVPTSLLSQVDASIGGKVAIDHPHGKNLIGAFYPPRLVLADPAVLLTMPRRQLVEGWAEVIKHGVALDAAYFESFERDAAALLRLEPAATTAAIAGSVAIKGNIVAGDERESEGGQRALLNYGHTLGHAVEAVTGYGTWLHGEAVAVGMAAAARIGARVGITPASVVKRQDTLLERFGLPVRMDDISAPALLRAALWDKKVRGGKVRWVLPKALGSSAVFADVSEEDVRAVLLELGAVDDEPPPR
ncbi:MAG TPA: 3-dehydroquinate synthase [Ktedonobacterales bacterium]|nr:3-dehydroquinate synthase [Ktedonobacterales bacterium]